MADTTETRDIVGEIMAYEQGELDGEATLALFSELIRTGQAWFLQGSYGRAATYFLDHGIIGPDGEILQSEIDY